MPTFSLPSLLRNVYGRVRLDPASDPRPETDLKRLFFLHIPKCGGQSVGAALQAPYLAARLPAVTLSSHASARAADLAGEDLHDFRQRLLLYYMAGPARYLSGHFMFSEAAWNAFGDDWHYVTVLREPVARWISNYFYNKYKRNDHFRITEPVEAFIETERAVGYGRGYVQWLNGDVSLEEAASEQAIERAAEHLSQFKVVGLLERLGVFTADYERYFGVPITIGHRNENPRRAVEQREELSEEVMARIQTLCAPNMRVYEAVQKRIDEEDSWLRSAPVDPIA